MSSILSVKGGQGFVISTDSIVFKYMTDSTGHIVGKVKGITRKLFQIHNDIVVVGLGNWNTYFPMFNMVAKMQAPKHKLLDELRNRGRNFRDTRIYIFSRDQNCATCDFVENGEVKLDQTGAVMFPEPALNSMFLALYESPEAMKIRLSGMLGMAAIVHAYNSFAASMCNDISAPFDTILFLNDGIFNFSGGTTKLPVGDFI
jgi:hypothetical protein